MYSVIDLSELFVLFHEYQHYLPPPPNLCAKITMDLDPSVSPDRQAKWLQEYTADCNAVRLLLISVDFTLREKLGFKPYEADRTAAQIVFAGADAALHTLAMLEKIRHGELSHADAGKAYEYRTHPPAQERRINVGLFEKALCLNMMGDSGWSEVQKDVSSMVMPREKLFDAFFASKSDLVNNIRNGLQNG